MTAMKLVTVGEASRRSDWVCVRRRGYPGASQGYVRVGEYRGGALILFT